MGKDTKRKRSEKLTRVEWPTVAFIAGCYGLWLLAASFLWTVLAFVVIALCVALHSSLTHEAAHGHPTRKAWLNELLVALPIGVFWPYRRFKTLHLRHHADERLTDPFDDPESYYQSLWHYRRLPVWMQALLGANNTMVGRFILGPALATGGFLVGEARLLLSGDRAVRKAWLHHGLGLVLLAAIAVPLFAVPLWLYLCAVYLGHSIIAIRTFAEHRWAEDPNGRTIIVENSPLALLFLNNNLHFVHHAMPNVAWYRLPSLFRSRRKEWVARNRGYVYPGYLALLRDFALKPKEPVAHPALRRTPEPGTAFTPRMRTHSVNGLGTAPVPAEPPRE